MTENRMVTLIISGGTFFTRKYFSEIRSFQLKIKKSTNFTLSTHIFRTYHQSKYGYRLGQQNINHLKTASLISQDKTKLKFSYCPVASRRCHSGREDKSSGGISRRRCKLHGRHAHMGLFYRLYLTGNPPCKLRKQHHLQ